MRNLIAFCVLNLLALMLTGCSREAKMARHMERAEAQFGAGRFDQAEIEYLNVLRLNPTNQPATLRLGVIALQQGRIPQAFTRLRRAMALDTNNMEAHLQLLICQVTGGAPNGFSNVVSYLNRVPTNGPAMLLLADTAAGSNLVSARKVLGSLPPSVREMPEFHVAMGTLALRDRDLDSAHTEFQRALALNAKASELRAAMGNFWLAKNDPRAALTEFKAAAEFAPVRSAHQIRYADFLASTGDTNAAVGVLEGIVKSAPDYLPAQLRLAELALAAGNRSKCEELLGVVQRYDPVNLNAFKLMAQLRLVQGDLPKAASELKRAVEEYPRHPELHYRLAVVSMASGDSVQANKSLNEALAVYPDYSEALLLLAQLNVSRGDLEPAIKQLTKVLQANPQSQQAQILLATAHRGRGDLDQALKIYATVERAATNSAQAPYLSGLVLREQGKSAEARRSFETALKRNPAYQPAIEQLIYLDLAEDRFAAARARAENEISRSPSNAAPYLLLARVHLAETNAAAARETLEKAVAIAPDSGAVKTMLAKIYVAAKEEAAAITALNEVVARNTNDVAAWMQLGVLHEAAGNYTAARTAYEKLLAANPRHGPALNNLAYILSEHLNEPQRAYELASKARELYPKDPYLADTFGWVLFRNGEYPRALALVSEGVRRFPDNPELQFHLGMIHYMMGDEPAARIALQSAVERGDPKAGWMEKAQAHLRVLAIPADGNAPIAIPELEKLSSGAPNDPVLQMRLATAYERAAQWPKAAKSYEQALAINTNLMPALIKLAELCSERLNDAPRALSYARRARDRDPANPKTAHTLGRIAFGAARTTAEFQWAHGLLQESVRGLPEDSGAHFDLARAAYALGQVTNAILGMRRVAAWNPPPPQADAAKLFLEITALPLTPGPSGARVAAVLKEQPDFVPALMVSAGLLEAEGKAQAARDVYEQVLRRYPAFSPAYKPLALLYSGELKEPQKAYDYATKAREADPADMQVARLLGALSYERGLYPAAIQLLKQSSQTFPADGQLFYMLGLAQHKSKASAADCKASLTRALTLAPEAPFAAEAKAVLASLK